MRSPARTDPRVAVPDGDSRRLIAADLRSLVAQIEAGIRLIETAMPQDTCSNQPGSADVFVLDDVTAPCAAASAAPGACKADLDLALRRLSDSGMAAAAIAAVRRSPFA